MSRPCGTTRLLTSWPPLEPVPDPPLDPSSRSAALPPPPESLAALGADAASPADAELSPPPSAPPEQAASTAARATAAAAAPKRVGRPRRGRVVMAVGRNRRVAGSRSDGRDRVTVCQGGRRGGPRPPRPRSPPRGCRRQARRRGRR